LKLKLTISTASQINQLLRQSSLILIAILLAKTGLATEEIGIYESLFYIGTTFTFFWLNGLLQVILADTPSVKNDSETHYIFNISLIINFLSIVIFIILILFKACILQFLISKNTLPYYEWYCVYLLLNSPPYILESIWLAKNKPTTLLQFSIFSNLLMPVALVFPLLLGYLFEKSFMALCVLAAFRYIILTIYVYFNSVKKIDIERLKSIWKTVFPLILYTFLSGFVTVFTNWLINRYYNGDLNTFAIYRFGAREFPIVQALTLGLSSAFIPQITEGGVSVVKEKSKRLWHWIFPLTLLALLTSKYFFPIVFNPAFAESAAIFNIFLLLILSRALFPQSILMAFKETKILLKISIIETLFIALLSVILIQIYGMAGVAWSIVMGYLLEKFLIILFLKRKYNIDLQDFTDMRIYLFYACILIIAYSMSVVF
jgi:O-antigen/teichoic acid export membrane protein